MELKSEKVARSRGVKWHRWILKLIQWSNSQSKEVIRQIHEFDDQEHCS